MAEKEREVKTLSKLVLIIVLRPLQKQKKKAAATWPDISHFSSLKIRIFSLLETSMDGFWGSKSEKSFVICQRRRQTYN